MTISNVLAFSEATKTCLTCNETKLLLDFYYKKGARDGHRGDCKICQHHKNKIRCRIKAAKRRADRGILPVDEFHKRCPKCGANKLKIEFFRSKQGRSGYSGWCKSCLIQTAKKNRKFHGISLEQARDILRRQLGRCANRGCGKELSFEVNKSSPNKALVDHCHKTKKVRGILCYRCNTGASYIENDENLYAGLLEYLAANQ